MLMALALPRVASAYDFSVQAPTGQMLYYNITSSNTVSVTCPIHGWDGYTKPSDTLLIPSSVENYYINYTVTAIGDYAFDCCEELSFVSVPSTVTSFGYGAFANCSSLTQITIPFNVSYIGSWCFSGSYNLSEFYVHAITPPTLAGSAFSNSASSKNFHIPVGTLSAYQSSWGAYYTYLEVLFNFNVNVNTNDSTYGTGSYSALSDSTIMLIALANYGYHFDHWSTGSTANPDTITIVSDSTVTAYFIGLTVISDSSVYGTAAHTKIGDHLEKITATANYGYHFDHWSNGSTVNPDTITLVGDSTVTAFFERNTYYITANVNDSSFGSVANDSAFYLDTLMVVAIPVVHHHVVSWHCQGIVNISTDKDTVWVRMTGNRTLTCNFAIDTHTVNAVPSDPVRGMVTQSGTEFVYLTPCTVEAIPYSGYTFAGWSDGATYNPYTFAVTKDVELTAIFLAEGEVDIEEINAKGINVYSYEGYIVVEGAEAMDVQVFDIMGRRAARINNNGHTEALPNGIYLVKVGTLPSRKVAVIR